MTCFHVPCSWRPCNQQLWRCSWWQLCRLCGWSRSAGRRESAGCIPVEVALWSSGPSAYLKPAAVWGYSGLRGCTLKCTNEIIMNSKIINNIPLSELSEGAHIHLAAFIQISWSLWNVLITVGWKVLKFTLYGNRSGKGEENEDRSFNNYNNNIFGLTVSFSWCCINILTHICVHCHGPDSLFQYFCSISVFCIFVLVLE